MRELAADVGVWEETAPESEEAAAPGRRTLAEVLTPPERTATRSVGSGGIQLPDGLRSGFERSLGTSLADVRLHTDGQAASSARALGARAFATGTDISFGAGEYAPDSAAGRHLIAHEVAHTVQQRSAPAVQLATTVSQPGDAAEVEAEHAASAMLAGQAASVSAAPRHIARFGAEEHRDAAAEAAQGHKLATVYLETDPLHPLGIEDMAMLGGDVFGSAQEVVVLSLDLKGRRKLAWARWWARHKKERNAAGWSEPFVEEPVKQEIRDQFDRLAGDNVGHFSTGKRYGLGQLAAAGTYEQAHGAALQYAFLAASNGSEMDRRQAMMFEGFAQHFLSDMFAAGHVRTPRMDIESHYGQVLPNSGPRLVRTMAKRVASYLREHNPVASRIAEHAPFVGVDLEDEAYGTIMKLGGAKLEVYSMADIVSEAFHMIDGKGIDVVSERNLDGDYKDFQWKATGDNRTGPGSTGYKMTVAALRASLDDLERASKAGKGVDPKQALDFALELPNRMKPFSALDFAPKADPASKTNKTMEWHWDAWNDEMRAALDEVITSEIVPELRNVTPSVCMPAKNPLAQQLGKPDTTRTHDPDDASDDEVCWNAEKDIDVSSLDIGDAFESMVNEIELLKHRWLRLAMLISR